MAVDKDDIINDHNFAYYFISKKNFKDFYFYIFSFDNVFVVDVFLVDPSKVHMGKNMDIKKVNLDSKNHVDVDHFVVDCDLVLLDLDSVIRDLLYHVYNMYDFRVMNDLVLSNFNVKRVEKNLIDLIHD